MIRLALLMVLLASSMILTSEDAPVYNYTNWQTIKNDKLKFSVKLPEKWKFIEQKEPAIQAYLMTDNPEAGEKDVSAKKLLVESKEIGVDLKKVGDDMAKFLKSGAEGKVYIRDRESKLGELPSREFTYHFKEDGFEKTADVVIVKYNKAYYSISYITSSRTAMHDKPLREQIFATFNFEVMQPSLPYEFTKPKDWFDLKDNEYAQAFSKKDKGNTSPSDGIIKIKTVRVDVEKSLQQFSAEYSSTVTKPGAITSGYALTSPINGNKLMWFDIEDKEKMFKERYHIAKDGYTFYIIYFISSQELFDKELKMVLAQSLLSFKLLPPK